MRNRWFHKPELHSSGLNIAKKVTWLELFFDLVFVAVFIQLGNELSHDINVDSFRRFTLIFIPIWIAWTGFAFYVNRFTVDDIPHRLLVFGMMFAVGGMAIGGPIVLQGHHRTFAVSCACAQMIIAVLFLRAWIQAEKGRSYSQYWGSVFAVGSVLWLISALLPGDIARIIWVLGVCLIFVAPFSKESRALDDQYPWDEEHLAERYGLLTIIVLGESFVKVLSALVDEGAGIKVLLQGGLLLLLTCCIWWIYFDDVAGSRIKKQRFMPIIWLYSHLPLQIGVTATAVAIKKAVELNMTEVAEAKYRWMLSVSLGLTLLSVAVIDYATERRQAELSDRARVGVRFASAILIFILAPAGASMVGGMYLGLVTAICVAQVVFDMMMAPLEAMPDHGEVPGSPLAEIARRQLSGDLEARRSLRRDVGEAVRRGTPSALRNDLYYFFMDGGWIRYLVSLVFLFIMVNVLFASLYVLKPDCIAAARPSSFVDAFFFSVQTISTIGYGVMSPATVYGNSIVTIEAMIGLLSLAMITGLTFAKVSRPRARVLFSDSMVITKYEGRKSLIFRAGNARGNEIVDATMHVTLARDEISTEGHHMRRMHDLPLLRNETPLFVLSWSVIHIIDENSPFHGMRQEDLERASFSVIATLTGHDSTYAQTVHARHIYYSEQILEHREFVDIISELPDGRLMVDYTLFHETKESDQPA